MKKILIVDDYEIITDLLKDELCEYYECICGDSANDIVKYANEVDLIISDYGIFWKHEDGQKDFVWSTNYLKNATVPKILITGVTPNDGYNDLNEDKKHVDKVFFKPFSINEVKNAIIELLRIDNAQ